VHALILGLLLGWGAAIPIGPMNLEIVRRNITLGTRYGIAFGVGACLADLTYLIFLAFGAMVILSHPTALRVAGIVGSIILAWFGYQALTIKNAKPISAQLNRKSAGLPYKHTEQGYMLTLINPYTILFWSSVSTQLVTLSTKHGGSVWFAGTGVMIATLSWAIGLNIFIHFTRHKLPANITHRLNLVGGIILLGFAVLGLWHSF